MYKNAVYVVINYYSKGKMYFDGMSHMRLIYMAQNQIG